MSTQHKKRALVHVETLEGRQLLSTVPLVGASRQTTAAAELGAFVGPVGVTTTAGGAAAGVTVGGSQGVRANSLVGMVAALSIKNTTTNVINYQLRWSNSGAWVSYSLNPGVTRSHSIATSWNGTTTGRPSVRFDKSFNPGFQEQIYALSTKIEVEHARDNFYLGKEYLFKRTANGVDLYQKV